MPWWRVRPLSAEHQLRLWSYSSWSSVQSWSHSAMSYSEPFVSCLHRATASLTICVTLWRAASFTVTSAVVRR